MGYKFQNSSPGEILAPKLKATASDARTSGAERTTKQEKFAETNLITTNVRRCMHDEFILSKDGCNSLFVIQSYLI